MPLGDSITEITCWRALVWDQLASAGLASSVQYVGSQNSNPQGCRPSTSNWDQHHEGHSGWLAVDIANNYLEGWLKKTPADIVMFMLGTNDVTRGKSTSDVVNAYTKMVGIMRASNPRVKIIVSCPPPPSPLPLEPIKSNPAKKKRQKEVSNKTKQTSTPTNNPPLPKKDRPNNPPLLLQQSNPGHQRADPQLGRQAQHHRVAHRHCGLL